MEQRNQRDQMIFRRRIRRHSAASSTACILLIVLGIIIIPAKSLVSPYRRRISSKHPSLFHSPCRSLQSSKQNEDFSQITIEVDDDDEYDILEELERLDRQQPSQPPPNVPVCRIVSRADSKLPTTRSALPAKLFQEPHLLEKLDAYYNAEAYKCTKSLGYLQKSRPTKTITNDGDYDTTNYDDEDDDEEEDDDDDLVSFVRSSLEDAGFQLLSQRDLDLCDTLNVGYLLRLSIAADLSQLDPVIATEFYPELYEKGNKELLLFGGRCLVFWRGYSQEVTTGRLILPKLDYLQTSLVRRSAAWVKKKMDKVERKWSSEADKQAKKIQSKINDLKDSVLPENLRTDKDKDDDNDDDLEIKSSSRSSSQGVVDLGRYGGAGLRFVSSPDPDDALDPFMVCEVFDNEGMTNGAFTSPMQNSDVENDMNEKLNHQGYLCEYDKRMDGSLVPLVRTRDAYTPRVHLLERVSISNLVNIFTQYGRRSLISTIFAKSELVEPTFEEVVVVWKPLAKEPKKLYPPKFVSDLADIFDIDGFEQPPKRRKNSSGGNLEIRNFQGVPMSNIQAVFPKTKLVFRPADALLFDTVSIVTFALVLGSIRLDSPRLDLLALISVGLWIFRTVIRYSNKLARYDLLVKNFLTSKISHRNDGALKYLASEAALQRAIRSSLVLSWLDDKCNGTEMTQGDNTEKAVPSDSQSLFDWKLLTCCVDEVNQALNMEAEVEIDVNRALKDLEDLELIRISPETGAILQVSNSTESVARVEEAWSKLLVDRNAGMRQRKKKDDKETEESMSDIANMIASNLLSSLEENREPIQKAIKAAQEKGYTKMKEVIEDEENRKRFESALKKAKEKGYRGYTKVKDLIKDKRSLAVFEEALLRRSRRGNSDDSINNDA